MSLVFERIGYEPTEAQLTIHESPERTKLVAGGERAGKSYTSAKELVAWVTEDAVTLGPGRLYWIVGPDYLQARREFLYAYADFQKLGSVAGVSLPAEGRLVLQLKGGITIETRTGEEAMKFANESPDGILMTEAAQQLFQNFEKLYNRLAESRNRGSGHFYISGTFESSLGWYPEFFIAFQGPNLYGARSFPLASWTNLWVFPGGWMDPEMVRLRAILSPDLFNERFGGIPCPPRDLVFREFRHTQHIVPMRFGNVAVPTRVADGWLLPQAGDLDLWIDPGYAGAYAVLFMQVFGGAVFHVDEVYAQQKTGEQVIYETMAKRDLFSRVKRGVIDIAGRQHNAMESQIELWLKKAKLGLRSQAVPIVDGIQRHRTFLVDPSTLQPRIYHDPRCVGTIKEYGLYRYPEVKENRDERELPIDANNHSMKAIAYGLWDHFGYVDLLRKREQRSVIRKRSAY